MRADRVATRRIGVTMRRMIVGAHGEVRDALAADWTRFLAAVLPEVAWLPVPNAGPETVSFAERWQLDGLILTGGEDIGADPTRDESERHLLRWAAQHGHPILGICRGLQLLHAEHGGALVAVAHHVAARHVVHPSRQALPFPLGGFKAPREVNSYHNWALPSGTLPGDLMALAHDADGHAEAVHSQSLNALGLMWHPEREAQPDAADRQLIREWFGYDSELTDD